MSAIEWYFARGNKQMGPVSPTELKRFAVAGDLLPDDLVWREGLTEWAPARNVRGLFGDEHKPEADEALGPSATAISPSIEPVDPTSEATAASPIAPPAPSRHLFDVILDWIRAAVGPGALESAAGFFRKCGSWGLLAAIIVYLTFAVTAAFKTGSTGFALGGAAFALLLAALHYIAGKSCALLAEVEQDSCGELRSAALPNFLAVAAFMAALAAVSASGAAAVGTSIYPLIVLGLLTAAVYAFAGCTALHPAAMNMAISADDKRASRQAVGVLLLLLKMVARIVPATFGAGVVSGLLIGGYACYQLFFGGDAQIIALPTAMVGSYATVYSALLPLAVYLLFLLCSLLLDLFRSILTASENRDEPAQSQNQAGLGAIRVEDALSEL